MDDLIVEIVKFAPAVVVLAWTILRQEKRADAAAAERKYLIDLLVGAYKPRPADSGLPALPTSPDKT